MSAYLKTDPYKGTRDFYPQDMAILRHIFDMWSRVAESYGYARYDASILESAELYKSKGAENEELVSEQTYTFVDRGNREVTLRPEMTPTVARMISARRRELSFPVRWYSIPNLFRYERPQRGRLREHWQFNCDIFGVDDVSADIEIIALAHRTLTTFGATDEMFRVHVNDRALMHDWYTHTLGFSSETIRTVTRLVDKRNKMSAEEFETALRTIVPNPLELIAGLDAQSPETFGPLSKRLVAVTSGLRSLGITNVVFDASIARGFDYYTGTVFEIFDNSPLNNRAMIGGGRYDNLTALFGGEPIAGVGFGMGDVIMHDFLEVHALLPNTTQDTIPMLTIIPTDTDKHVPALVLAELLRVGNTSVDVDVSERKLSKKIGIASERGVQNIIVVGDEEIRSGTYTLKNLTTGKEDVGNASFLLTLLSN